MHKWYVNSGPEWTVKRVKDLEQFAKSRVVQTLQEVEFPVGWSLSSSRKYPKRFKDDLIHRIFSSEIFDLEIALLFTRISTSIVLSHIERDHNGKLHVIPDKPSKVQLDKVLTAIEGPPGLEPVGIKSWGAYLSPMLRNIQALSSRLKHLRDPKLEDLGEFHPLLATPKSSKSAPYFDSEGLVRVGRRDSTQEVWSPEILYTDFELANFFVNNRRFVSDCILGAGSDFLLPLPHPGSAIFKRPIGTLSFIQEPGAKLRTVANPFLAVQSLLRPLKVQLKRISQSIPEIVTYDQDEGRRALKQWISDSKKVWSLDASSFTDRFPLSFQDRVLEAYQNKSLISKEMLEIFRVVSTKPFYFDDQNRNVYYKYGQGQGLESSFNVATIAHYELLKSIQRHLKLGKGIYFYLVGDDVIINHPDIAKHYIFWMQSCNVEINLSKSIISDKLGEFAGAQITSDQIILRPKLRVIDSRDKLVSNFMMLNPDHKVRFLDIMYQDVPHLMDVLHIPEDFGGARSQLAMLDQPLHDLHNLRIAKSRIRKELKQFLPKVDEDQLRKYLEYKDYIKSGILHGSYAYVDDPAVIRDYMQKDSTISLAQFPIDHEARDLLNRIPELLRELNSVKSMDDLHLFLYRNRFILSPDGYLTMSDLVANHIKKLPMNEISNLISVEPDVITTKGNATRRKPRTPSDFILK
jgi:hypothetical protein